MKKRIVQFSAGFMSGDAISNEMTAIDSCFRQKGFDTAIYSGNIGNLEEKTRVRKYFNYSPSADDILIYHHSIHSGILDRIKKYPVKKVLIYHNVTPYHFFEPYDLVLSSFLKKGREDLALINELFDLSIADSAYNASELESLGFKNVVRMPIHYDFDKLKKYPKKKSRKKNILFVGRVVPNKKQDDLLRFAAVYKTYINPDFRLNIVGYCPKELNLYREELDRMVAYYGLKDNVFFSEYVTSAELHDLYSQADLFLSMSEHEGFCVPIIEAMYYGVPVMAYGATAVPETMADAGVLFLEKDFSRIALMAEKLLYDREFGDKILQGQDERIRKYRETNSLEKITEEIVR